MEQSEMHENKVEISLARLSILALVIGVSEHHGIPRASDLLGCITNDDIADSVAESLAFRMKRKVWASGPAGLRSQ